MTSDGPKKQIDQLRPSSYDGIQEYDNDLPRWWVWLFYLTGVYAAVYIVAHYGFGMQIPPMPHEPVGVVVASNVDQKGSAQVPAEDEAIILKARLGDGAALDKGKEIYASRCAPCHGATGGGVIGPNLADDNWIHGGTLVQIKHVIENGVTEKGMLAWKSMLSQEDIRAVTVYVRSLRGTNPGGAKGPEGVLYTGEE